ncbi:hypothetical protein PS2_014 [Serratia phage PS2]|uniref:Uncharacterized protein n=1 Tax=Serratia phage PS2 TaxID=1481112 RepID=A0A023W4V1_9CAUD|nr:MazG-like pyrophosphatase [Serratia phage PS2]AHY25265.1 hypothetical protein PS2_014 [Serratia phage PS2]
MIHLDNVLSTSAHVDHKFPWRPIEAVMLQLSSETGEMCDWINRPWRQKEPFEGECADVIICVIDALRLYIKRNDGIEDDIEIDRLLKMRLNAQIEKKTKKWREVIDANLHL